MDTLAAHAPKTCGLLKLEVDVDLQSFCNAVISLKTLAKFRFEPHVDVIIAAVKPARFVPFAAIFQDR